MFLSSSVLPPWLVATTFWQHPKETLMSEVKAFLYISEADPGQIRFSVINGEKESIVYVLHKTIYQFSGVSGQAVQPVPLA